MAGERGSKRRGYDPLVAGISDGVAAGYQALEYVFQGLSESLERRPGTRSRHERDGERRRPARGVGPPLDIVDDLASLFAELLGRVGEVAQETASSITDRSWVPAQEEECVRLEITAEPGGQGFTDFRVWNPSSKVLNRVDLMATDLIGHEETIDADAVTFAPTHVDRIPPNRSASPKVVVQIPEDASLGTYRGVIQAMPGQAWAVLEVTVKRHRPAAPHPDEPAAAQSSEHVEPEPAEEQGAELEESGRPPSARDARRRTPKRGDAT
jgi:hypothetical protein